MAKTKKFLHAIANAGKPPFPFAMGEHEWRLPPKISSMFQCKLSPIIFGIQFSDGSWFTDKKYSRMFDVTQLFLKDVWENNTPAQVYDAWHALTSFVKFSVEKRTCTEFNKVYAVDEYISIVKNRKPHSKKSSKMRPPGITHYLFWVKKLWRFSNKMPFGLKTEPWQGRSSCEAAGTHTTTTNKVLPYSIYEFGTLIKSAIAEVQNVDSLVAYINDSSRQSRGREWFQQLPARLADFRAAASIVIFGFTGIHISTLANLTRDCIKQFPVKTQFGTVILDWLCGRIYRKKQNMDGVEWKWVAASEVVEAVAAIEKVRQALLDNLKGTFRKNILRWGNLLFFSIKAGNSSTRLFLGDSLRCIRKFVEKRNLRSDDGGLIKTTHQRFRPSFARVMARLGLGDIAYFRFHYGHSDANKTLGYFATFAEDDMQADVQYWEDREKTEIIENMLSSNAPLQGKRGEQFEPLRRRFAVVSFRNMKEVAGHIARGHNIRVTPHSLCIAPRDVELCDAECVYEEAKCAGCHNGVITENHILQWESMEKKTENISGCFPPGSPAFEHWQANLTAIRQTISRLKSKVPVNA